jgi:hypothetical protein
MGSTEEVIEGYLEQLKEPGLAQSKFAEITSRIRALKALDKEG